MAFEDLAAAKRTMRQRILEARQALEPEAVDAAAASLAERALALPELTTAATVAAYYSVDAEPGTRPLITALLDSGRRVLLPVVLPDRDLDWAELTDRDDLTTTRLGLREPAGKRLGTDAVAAADLVFCPGLAVDATGARMGRGAGCYDRALRRLPTGTLRCIVLYDHEVIEAVPFGADDERVDAVVTPNRTLRFG